MKNNFTSKKWKKNWDGGWSILSCYYFGHQYTKQLREVLGKSLNEVLFISHNGISACYFIDEYKKEFGIYFSDQVIKNPEIISEWAKKLKATTGKIINKIKELKNQKLSLQNFNSFIQGMYDFGVYNRIIKTVVDYLPEDLLKKYLDELTNVRVYAEPVYEETENYMKHIANEIASGKDIKPELILAMTKSQFMEYFESNKLPFVEILEKQFKDSALYISQEDEQFFSGNEVTKIEEALLKNSQSGEIYGQTAYAGKVTGRVRIILNTFEAKEFNEGDILVAGMTRPEYLLYIKKCAGFITDAGGILSHAAITARELKKPCVIGTEIATKILKDGDLVEVDANKGIIKKLQ